MRLVMEERRERAREGGLRSGKRQDNQKTLRRDTIPKPGLLLCLLALVHFSPLKP
jgi:hypothetical protein